MSDNHKRPLFAFVVVAIACGLIIANGVRTEALVGLLRAGAQHVVAGVPFVPDAPHRTTVPARAAAAEPAPVVSPAAPTTVRVLAPSLRTEAPVRHRPATGAPAWATASQVRADHPVRESGPAGVEHPGRGVHGHHGHGHVQGHAKGHAHGRAHGHRAHGARHAHLRHARGHSHHGHTHHRHHAR